MDAAPTPLLPASESAAKPPYWNSREGLSLSRIHKGVANDEDETTFLARFDTIFLVDDIITVTDQEEDWTQAARVVSQVTEEIVKYNPDGIDLYLSNPGPGEAPEDNKASGGYYNITKASQVEIIFKSIGRLDDLKPLSYALGEILKAYLAKLDAAGDQQVKPINIVIVSNGGGDYLEDTMRHYAEELDRREAEPEQVGIHLCRVGRNDNILDTFIPWRDLGMACPRSDMLKYIWREDYWSLTSGEVLAALAEAVSDRLRWKVITNRQE